ncbi:hypothetical protein H0H81_002315 [Sphagnurus paluster]|uniref:Uncharacterized protein n=1 Tax=Sphagnurus paluster TaxID=117069 RepID=A0A9P7FW46_9AGAR|nr:hypothetical protein H0H81_002315 [Sphagnurus paluster]
MDKSKTPQLPDPKLALITPSASPPHTRPFFPQPYRIPDQASPTKRPRLSSAPRQLKPPVSASSSSTSVDVVDFQKAREESTMRLLDVWAGLAERYSRALDEDDIIDITTGNVVKDRGVIRGPQTWNEGAFTEATQDEDEEEEEEDEVDEDEVDELDTLANPGLSSQEAEGRRVPPVREMDPYDARDLKEFLEAEQRRREIYGSEVDDTDGSVVEDAYTEEIRQGAPVNGSLYDDATRDEEEDGNPRQDIDEEATQRRVKPIYIDSGSDDELGNWECDEASIVYRLPKSEVAEDSDSEIEFVEPPMKARSLSPEVPFPSPRKPEKSNPVPAQRQLQTPPRSQSSSIPSATPDDYFIQLPPSSPPQSSSPPSSRCESSPIKPKPGKRSLSKPRSEQKRVHPLHTTFGDPIPRLDLKKVSRDRQGKTKVPQPRTPARTPQASNSASFYSHTQTTSKKPVPAPQSRRTKTPQRIVEAFIEQHPREETIKSVSSSQPRVQDVPTEQVENRRKKVVAVKAKGKKKVVSVDAEEIFEDDSNSRRSSPIGRRGTPRLQNLAVQQSASTLTSKDTEDQHTGSTGTKSKYGPMGTCSTSSGTIGRKRKRVVSAAEVGEEVPPPIADIQPSSSSASTSRARYLSMDSESVEPESSKGTFISISMYDLILITPKSEKQRSNKNKKGIPLPSRGKNLPNMKQVTVRRTNLMTSNNNTSMQHLTLNTLIIRIHNPLTLTLTHKINNICMARYQIPEPSLS